VTVSFAYVNMREGLSVVSLYWRSNNKREIQKHFPSTETIWLTKTNRRQPNLKPLPTFPRSCQYSVCV
jgi:hypothetical protein